MVDLPPDMVTRDRHEDPRFDDSEALFRRFAPECLDGASLSIDALELPDMSVNREKYGPPEWLLLPDDFRGWGVFGFVVGEIPHELLHLGVSKYTFSVRHRPLKNNYPHSEVWAFLNEKHIDAKTAFLLDPDVNLRWRQMLLWKCKLVIMPIDDASAELTE